MRRQPAPDTREPGGDELIGLGEIGQVHAAAVRRSGSARLVAVADTVPDLLAPFEARGARGYPGADELIADPQVGTVCVCLPQHLHFPVAMAAVRAGLNVLVEKPLAVSLEQAQQMVDATHRLAGLESLFVGYRTGTALSMFRDRRWREVPVRADDWPTSVQASVAAYLDAVAAGREPPVTGTAALETMRLLDRIYRTAVVLRP